MPSESALQRVARVIDLIPFLHHREVNLNDLADRLGIDVREIERDLEIAFLCGLPGYTPDLLIDMSMEDGFVTVSEPQSLNIARRLTTEEMASLQLGLELIDLQFGSTPHLKMLLESLRRKIHASRETQADVIFERNLDEDLEVVEAAILKPSRIRFGYLDSIGKISQQRIVSPSNFFWRGGRLLLRGFDHEKEGTREFFTARMMDVRAVAGDVVRLEEQSSRPHSDQPQSATICFNTLPMWWKRRNSAFISSIEFNASEVRIVLRYWNQEWLIRALLPVLDLIVSIDADGVTSDDLRTRFLSHFSGFDATE